MKNFIRVKCPCCNHVLEIDAARERVISDNGRPLFARKSEDPARAFDDVVEGVRDKEKDRDRKFDDAQERVKRSQTGLDDLFREALRRAKDDDAPPEGGGAP